MLKLAAQDYYNMNQLSYEWGVDLNQLLQTLKKYSARIWIYINDKRCRFNYTSIGLFEAEANTLKDEDFFRLAKLTNKKLIEEGFSITQLPDKGTILAKRGTEEILIHRSKKKHFVSLPSYKANATEINHDGFIELRPEFLTDIKINITNLFNGNETYIVTVRCPKPDFIRFLHPAIFIKLNDLYLSRNEFERLNNILKKRNLEMLPHIRSSNLLKRADQIASLFSQICVEHPVRIDVEKITQSEQSINLAWIIAFCCMKYDSYADVSYKDFALNAMAENIRKALIDKLQENGELHKLNAKYYDEVDFATETTVTKILSHKLPPEVIKSLLQNNYKKFVYKEDMPNQATNNPSALEKIDEPLSNDSETVKYHKDAIAIAVIEHILPNIFPKKENINLDKDSKWACFTHLKEALLKNEAKNVEMYREKNKDNSTIAGTDKHGATIDCNFKSFRGRLPNLIAAYKQII